MRGSSVKTITYFYLITIQTPKGPVQLSNTLVSAQGVTAKDRYEAARASALQAIRESGIAVSDEDPTTFWHCEPN